jgi:hypothetical protein
VNRKRFFSGFDFGVFRYGDEGAADGGVKCMTFGTINSDFSMRFGFYFGEIRKENEWK